MALDHPDLHGPLARDGRPAAPGQQLFELMPEAANVFYINRGRPVPGRAGLVQSLHTLAAKLAELPEIDLLIVDGPSGRSGPLARRPALPLLWPKLGPNAVIVMDDADRDDERRIAAAWRDRYPSLRCEHVPTRKGAYVLLRGRD